LGTRRGLINGFIEECAQFPSDAHDDQVDAMIQVLLRWHMPPQTLVYVIEPPLLGSF